MVRIKFNFENERATFNPPRLRRGALTSFSDTQSGLTILIKRGRSSFDIVGNTRSQRKQRSFGLRSLDPFFRLNNPTPLTVNFSRGVYSVSIAMGDYGGDTDTLSLKAYSGLNGKGSLIDSRIESLPSTGTTFTSKVVTVQSNTPIRSIEMIGGSPSFRNSVFYDNLIVSTTRTPTPSPTSDNVPATARNIGTLANTFANQDVVGTTDSVDWYKFTLNQISELNYNITGFSSTANASIFFDSNNNGVLDDSEATFLAQLTNIGSDFLRALLPGNYYVRVTTATNVNTRYNLSLSITPHPSNLPRDPGSTVATALDITPFITSGSFTAKDAVGAYDPIDYYKFTLTRPRYFNVDNTTINSFPYSLQRTIYIQENSNDTYRPSGPTEGGYTYLGVLRNVLLIPGTYLVGVGTANNVQTRYELPFFFS